MDPSAHATISKNIQENPVVLYMKGSRQAPQCGFSARVVEILDGLLEDYVTVDVLRDPSLRDGIKAFSSWPTIPQLFVRGEFVGGADIVAALDESGELREKLGDLVVTHEPKVTLSEAALRELSGAIESPKECIRLDVSPAFEHDLAVGVPDPRDVIVDAGGVRVSMPAAAVRRADGIHIDVVDTPEGPAFKIDNPNEPAKVKRMSPAELKAKLDRGDDVLLIDARTPSEQAIATIAGGRLLDDTLREELDATPRERPIVVYCHHGIRSQRAAEGLVSSGFRDVWNLVGGIDAWSMDVDQDTPRY
ncbi:MAG TPA: Grx4 family monothiol glutaredoxin [Polyangiaceae bacterium]